MKENWFHRHPMRAHILNLVITITLIALFAFYLIYRYGCRIDQVYRDTLFIKEEVLSFKNDTTVNE